MISSNLFRACLFGITATLIFTGVSSTRVQNRTCSDPGVPINGGRIGNDFNNGSTITFYCHAGYVLVGPTSIQCTWINNSTLDINWTTEKPACNVTTSNQRTTEPLATTADRQESTAVNITPTVNMTPSGRVPVENTGAEISIIVSIVIIVIAALIVVVLSCFCYFKRRRRRRTRRVKFHPAEGQLVTDNDNGTLPGTTTEGDGQDGRKLMPMIQTGAKKGDGNHDHCYHNEQHTAQSVDNRPKLPAPEGRNGSGVESTEAQSSESFYQNAAVIAVNRSRQNAPNPATAKPVNGKPAKGKPAKDQPAKGKPAKDKPVKDQPAKGKPAFKNKPFPLPGINLTVEGDKPENTLVPADSDQIYENTNVVQKPSPRRVPRQHAVKPPQAAIPPPSVATTTQPNSRDSVDYVTPDETVALQQKVYQNAGMMRHGARQKADDNRLHRPVQNGLKNGTETEIIDTVYLEILADT